MKRCSDLGGTTWSLSLPPLYADAAAGAWFPRYQEALNAAYELMVQLRCDAERLGVSLALEAACGGLLGSPVELREVIDRAHSWALGACLDVDRLGSVCATIDWLDTLRHRVRVVRLRPEKNCHNGFPGVSSAGRTENHPDTFSSPREIIAAIQDLGLSCPVVACEDGAHTGG